MSDIALYVVQTRTEGMLGASEAAAALGLDRFTSPLTIWKRLRGLPTDEVRSPALDEAASWGHSLEPVIRGKYALDRNVGVFVPSGSFERDGWLRATPDGFVVPLGSYGKLGGPCGLERPGTYEWTLIGINASVAGLLQVKNRSAFLRDDWKGGTPPKEEIQCRVEMAVCDLPWNDCAVLIGGNQMLVHRVERDLALEDRILTDLRAFWQMVKDGREPSPDHTEAWRRHVSEKMRPSKVVLVADEETAEVVAYWLEQRRKRKKAQDEEDAARNDLLLRLSAAGATAIDLGHDKRITAYKTGGRTDWKAFAQSIAGPNDAPPQFKTEGKTWSLRAPSDDGDE